MQQGHEKIADLKPGAWFSGIYALQNPQIGATRAGKPYLKAILRDATGEASLRCWDVGEDPRKAEQALVPDFRNGLCANFRGHRKLSTMPCRSNARSTKWSPCTLVLRS